MYLLLSPSLFVIISKVVVVVVSSLSWVAVVVNLEIQSSCGDCVHVYIVVNSSGGSACPFI